MTEDVLANIKGKTVETVDDLVPNVRITFTDGSSVEFEAVGCGDLRVRYWLTPHGTYPISPKEPNR